ncbi:MAG: hypothetical protein OXM55_04055 [Bdellovibrionales bacterium]|nr:hypothetical protein [Bdellovibrionales bacterium]
MFVHKLLYQVLCFYISFISFQSFSADTFFKEPVQHHNKTFWSGTEYRWLTWEELHQAIIKYNQNNPQEPINSRSYPILYREIPGAPAGPWTYYPDFKERGSWPGLLGTPPKHLSLNQLIKAIVDYNNIAPKDKKINFNTYRKWRKKIPGAPPWPPTFYPDFKERGGWSILLGKPCPKGFVS